MTKVAYDQDCQGAPFRFLNGRFDRKVNGADTGGAVCIFDTIRSERGGPPLHIHDEQDEWFYVTEGRFSVRVGNETHSLEAGDSVLGPRGVPHAFTNETETGRIIVVFTPLGRWKPSSTPAATGDP